MGLPVIVTNIRGSREVVVEGVNGLIVPVHDANALYMAMLRLYDDPNLRKKLATGARKRAEEAFDERRVVRIILDIYDKLLQQAGRRPPQSTESKFT